MQFSPEIETRFWRKVDFTGNPLGCWVYLGGKISGGYGNFWLSHTKCELTHRFSWELLRGPIPSGLFVLHSCDNRPCVNPNHLFLGTQKDNILDAMNKDRQVKGESVGTSKLTRIEVDEIRNRREKGEMLTSLAKSFHVSVAEVWMIITKQYWKN